MKRLAKPGEGEVPVGASEVPGGGPQAYTCPETGQRMIDGYEVLDLGFTTAHIEKMTQMLNEEPEVFSDKRLMEVPKPSRKRK